MGGGLELVAGGGVITHVGLPPPVPDLSLDLFA